ncbi:FadR/GntR family transcriptional regulator [Leucobacter luti]|uniref:Pyruvate dehydrogenase complex repressor n=1 Tax=Leucobacter luti TaxID=340320 RepID=A0A4Q7TXL2_9MICO|nr:FCD domain-containing protein [Leucobacter luti]MBL3698596.1 FadR family transcriptional regulator [Leucobacter luti]RZT65971.1 GntR family transcriptional regulator [Leucobacter luti]
MQHPFIGAPSSHVAGPAAGFQGDGIAQRIATAISLGMLSVGERLPPEAELASQFGIAVATLRKALAALREQGVVETRRGRNGGTFVVQAPFPSTETLQRALLRISTVALRDFFDEHAAVSGMAARLAAERAVPEVRTRLAEFAFQAREAREPQDRALADSRFHFEVAVLSHSQRLLAGEQRLQSELSPFLWCDAISHASLQTAFSEHLAIVMAIEQRQPEEAQRLAVAHVQANARLILDGKFALGRAEVSA